MAWHPVESLQAIEFVYPRPGTHDPYAIIRWVNLELEGEPVSRWRCVTYKQPRRLIDAGYYLELEQAAMACHMHAIASRIPDALNDTSRREA